MVYETLANIVMAFHAILIFSVLIGILISVRYKKFRPLESAFLLCAVLIWSLYGGCPLTFLESFLRSSAGYPLPLLEVGFIPYYLNSWFNLSITIYQLTIATWITAFLFLFTSIEWMSPYVNIEVIKIRKFLGFSKQHSNYKSWTRPQSGAR